MTLDLFQHRGLRILLTAAVGMSALIAGAFDRQVETILAERQKQIDQLAAEQQGKADKANQEAHAALVKLGAECKKAGDKAGVAETTEAIRRLATWWPVNFSPKAMAAIPIINLAQFANRMPNRRRTVISQYAASSGEDAVKAVQRGLAWLKDNQNGDGSWGRDKEYYRGAMTGLSLLALLGLGENLDSPVLGDQIRAGIAWLKNQMETGRGVMPGNNSYVHPIAVMALAEMAGMTQDYDLAELVAAGVATIVRGQNRLGGFNYNYNSELAEDDYPRTDLSVGGWNHQALAIAVHGGGAGSMEASEAMIQAAECIVKRLSGSRGGFKYCAHSEAWDSPTMTSVGTYSLMLLGEAGNERTMQAVDLIADQFSDCDWKKAERWAIYRWYYQTNALFHGRGLRRGTMRWKKWQRQVTREVLANQSPDGSWLPPAVVIPKRDDDDDWSEVLAIGPFDSRIYATAMCCLILETWFRYPPLSEAK